MSKIEFSPVDKSKWNDLENFLGLEVRVVDAGA